MHKAAAEQKAATSRAAGGHEDILTAIERLAELHARGVLIEVEFSAKRAELLGSGLIDHSQNMTAAAMQIAEK
jgi:hypothetical protein